MRMQILFLLSFVCLSCTAASATGKLYKEGAITLRGSKFHYQIYLEEPGFREQRHMVVLHVKKKYSGALAKMSFRDRHLQVFGMVSQLIKDSCSTGVKSLGNIMLSADPERQKDPAAIHPQYFTWEYSCK